VPERGWQFVSWAGGVTEPNSANTTVTMDIDKTVTAIFEAPPFHLAQTFDFNHNITDALLSADGNYLYVTEKYAKELHIVNLTDGSDEIVNFDYMPESLTSTPAGDAVYVALLTREHSHTWFDQQKGYIAEISSDNHTLVRQFYIDEDPYDIIATSDNHLYVAPGFGQWDTLKSYDLITGALVGSVNRVYQSNPMALSPDETCIYGITTGLSPQHMYKYATNGGAVRDYYNRRWYQYHGEYSYEITLRWDRTAVKYSPVMETYSKVRTIRLPMGFTLPR
jgi:hypothetical protein